MITRNVNNHSIIIFAPAPNEVLEKEFSYPKYVENEIHQYLSDLKNIKAGKIDITEEEKILYSMYDNHSEKKEDEKEKHMSDLVRNYLSSINEIEREYEIAIKNGKYKEDKYTNKMKNIAQEYMNIKENFELTNLIKTKLLTDLKLIIEKKEIEKLETINRIKRYQNNEIPLAKLYLSDLEKIKLNTETRSIVERFRRRINISISSDEEEENIKNMTIEQLYDTYIKKKENRK